MPGIFIQEPPLIEYFTVNPATTIMDLSDENEILLNASEVLIFIVGPGISEIYPVEGDIYLYALKLPPFG
jgi:hypothetical protein